MSVATVQHPSALAREPDILARFERDIRRVGHIGEERITKLIYLAVTSRLLDKVVSVAMKGPSAAGKSAAVERVLRFFPAEAYYSLTGMSERALVAVRLRRDFGALLGLIQCACAAAPRHSPHR
jgi:hypothetical protein